MRHLKFKIFASCILSVCAASCTRPVRLTSVQSVEQGVFSAADADLATVSQIKSATQPEQKALPPSEMMRVGLLLPLSGKSAKLGEALRNAAMMSLFDISSGRLVLQFYDTEGTAEGARNASELAISQGAELIIGPIFSEEVRAIRENTHSADIGVITFSSHPSNLGDGVYTISTLTSQQVEHIVGYACDKGYKRIAILSQDNAMGDIVAMAAKSAADRCGATITKAGFYYSKTDNLQPTVQQVMPRLVEEMQKEKDEEIERLEKARADVLAGLPVKMKNEETGMEEERMMTMEELTATIETLKNTEIVRDPFEFDALLITEEGSRLRSLGALLSYYDVPKEVKILGTSQWANSSPSREPALVGGWFSNLPFAGFEQFSARYKKIYGEKPPRIASQAYDAVALAAVLAETGSFSYDNLTNPSGFRGVDGLFRLLPNGLSERGLEVLGVEKRGYVTLSPAPEVFETEPVIVPNVYEKGFRYSPEFIPPPPVEELIEETIIVDGQTGQGSNLQGQGSNTQGSNIQGSNMPVEGNAFQSAVSAQGANVQGVGTQGSGSTAVSPFAGQTSGVPTVSAPVSERPQPFVTPPISEGLSTAN